MVDVGLFRLFWSLLIVLMGCGQVFSSKPQPKPRAHVGVRQPILNAILIDGALHGASLYSHPINLFKNLGWRTSFYNVSDLLTAGVDAVFEKPAGVFIFSLGLDFWRSKRGSHVRNALCEAVAKALSVRGGVTLFAIPDGLGANAQLLEASLDGFFIDVGLSEFAVNSGSGNVLTDKLKSFISAPLSARSSLYDTSLRVASSSTSPVRLPQTFLKTSTQDLAISLPYWSEGRFSSKGALSPLIPLGFLLFSNKREHSFVFVSESVLKTFGVCEDFLVFPFKPGLQKSFEKIIQSFWLDVDRWARYSGSFAQSKIEELFSQRSYRKNMGTVFGGGAVPQPREKKKLTGWMELVVFERLPEEYESDWSKKCARQQELVEGILDARLDYLWLGLSPQMYYGKHAKYPEKKGIFEAGFKRFCRMLKNAAKERASAKIPAILLGYEIANNLYEPHLPAEYAVDIFGNHYRDVPAPTSKLFWQDEVTVPFQRFMAFLKTVPAEMRLPIAGVVFDLELYGRRLEGQFLSTMMCDNATRSLFMSQKSKALSPEAFVIKLTKEKWWKKYMAFVEGQVSSLALKMRQDMIRNNQNQKLAMAVYTPSITTDWFFKSFFKGLVSGGETLHWLTFNTNFSRIKRQVQHEFGGMSIDHSAVVMLSKVSDDPDGVSKFLQNLSSYNGGIWFNRWSRFVEPHDPSAWHFPEQPRLFEPRSKQEFLQGLVRLQEYDLIEVQPPLFVPETGKRFRQELNPVG